MDRIDIRKRSNEGDSLRASPVILRFLRRPRQSKNFIQGFDQFLHELRGLWGTMYESCNARYSPPTIRRR